MRFGSFGKVRKFGFVAIALSILIVMSLEIAFAETPTEFEAKMLGLQASGEVELNRSVELAPNVGLFFRGDYFAQHGQIDKAEADYRRTIEMGLDDYSFGGLRNSRAKFFEKLGKPEIAATDWEKAFKTDPRSKLDFFFARAGRFSNEIRKIQDQLTDLEKEPTKNVIENWISLSSDWTEIAQAANSNLLDLQFTYDELKKSKSSIFGSENKYDKIIASEMAKRVEETIDASKDGQQARAFGLIVAAERFNNSGLPRLAVHAYLQAHDLRHLFKVGYPLFDGAVWNGLIGDAYYWAGEQTKSAEHCKLAVADSKKGSSCFNEAILILARIHEDKKQYQESIAIVQEEKRFNEGANKTFYDAWLARLYAKSGNIPEAVRFYNSTLEQFKELDSKYKNSASIELALVENLLGA